MRLLLTWVYLFISLVQSIYALSADGTMTITNDNGVIRLQAAFSYNGKTYSFNTVAASRPVPSMQLSSVTLKFKDSDHLKGLYGFACTFAPGTVRMDIGNRQGDQMTIFATTSTAEPVPQLTGALTWK